MSEDFLSQEEVDALLKGATGDSDEAQEEEDKGGVRPYNIATQERIVRGRMPTYEIINELPLRDYCALVCLISCGGRSTSPSAPSK